MSQRDGARKIITGIVVNEKMQAVRYVQREFRKNVYFIKKYGVDGHIRRIGEKRKNYLLHIIGVGEFIRWADRTNTKILDDLAFLKGLRKPRAILD